MPSAGGIKPFCFQNFFDYIILKDHLSDDNFIANATSSSAKNLTFVYYDYKIDKVMFVMGKNMSNNETEYFELKGSTESEGDIWCKVAVVDGDIVDFIDYFIRDSIYNVGCRATYFYEEDEQYIGEDFQELKKELKRDATKSPLQIDKISEQNFIADKNIITEKLKTFNREESWEELSFDTRLRMNKLRHKLMARARYDIGDLYEHEKDEALDVAWSRHDRKAEKTKIKNEKITNKQIKDFVTSQQKD